MKNYIFIGFAVYLLGAPNFGHAQELNALSEEVITAYYQQMEDIQLKDVGTVMAFFEKHTAPNAHAVVNIKKKVMGKDGEDEVLNMNRKEILDRMKTAYNGKGLKEADMKILSTEINPDGKSARVKSQLIGKFKLEIKTPEGLKIIDATQDMLCDDIVILSPEKIIQTEESFCNLMATMGGVNQVISNSKSAQ